MARATGGGGYLPWIVQKDATSTLSRRPAPLCCNFRDQAVNRTGGVRSCRLSAGASSGEASSCIARSCFPCGVEMAGDDEQSVGGASIQPSYQQALDALSSLITKRYRADNSNAGDQFDLMFDYLKILELEQPLLEMKIIHVAGTKGKGSTCTFTESILRSYGVRTGLFTSPHLIDVRERFRLNGMEVSEEKFLANFWWCWYKLQEAIRKEFPMPNYFRFLTLLGFKIFSAEKVDAVILEVGLGGKFDATNVVQKPLVCGISSLGYDHMEILGNTLSEIAAEKAGILKHGVQAFTVPQPIEAMSVLKTKAEEIGASLEVVTPLDGQSLRGLKLGLCGNHQFVNASLAVSLAYSWLQRKGDINGLAQCKQSPLPEEFIKGLTTASLQGRAQVFPDPYFHLQNYERPNAGGLIFFLDGAHSLESMEACANWFSHAVQDSFWQQVLADRHTESFHDTEHDLAQSFRDELSKFNFFRKKSRQLLLFNCMSVRDPHVLLRHLMNTCASHGIYFDKALFVPNQSVFNKVGSHTLPEDSYQADLSWQYTLQKVWEQLQCSGRGERRAGLCKVPEGSESGFVFPTLSVALKWLRESAQKNQCTHFQVLVAGSLHLVGDVLRMLKR